MQFRGPHPPLEPGPGPDPGPDPSGGARRRALVRVAGRVLAGLVGTAGIAGPARSTQGPDPFAPHRRWVEAADPAAPWIPRSVAFAAGGELVLGAGSLGAPRALLLSSPDLSGAELVGSFDLSGALGTVYAAAGPGAGELYCLSQYPLGPNQRLTRATRLDAGGVAGGGAPLSSRWSVDLGAGGNGAARMALSADGSALAVASEESAGVLVTWLDPASGATRASRALPGAGLRGLALADDGGRLAVLAGAELFVLDALGATLHAETLALVTNALALAGDGSTVAVGDGADLRVLAEAGGPYLDVARIAGGAGEVVVCAALDRGGARVALGSWDQVGGERVRFRVCSTGGNVLHELAQVPGTLGLQNYPAAVALTPDGRRAAYAGWGVGDPQPELVLVDVEAGSAVLAVDLPGSARALALSEDGTRLAAGTKHVHANQLGSTGELVLHDTGERELQLLSRPTPAGGLALASKRPGSSRALFVFGRPVATPTTFRGAGSLWIDRGGPLLVRSAAPEASGRADLWLDVQGLTGLLGPGFGVQAAWRVGGATCLGALVLPVVL